MTVVKLQVNDEEIPLNPIMTTLFSNITLGFLDALKGLPEDKKNIKIEIEL